MNDTYQKGRLFGNPTTQVKIIPYKFVNTYPHARADMTKYCDPWKSEKHTGEI